MSQVRNDSQSPQQEPASPSAEPQVLELPELALVLLVGVSGSGKSTFAAKHFGKYEVLSSDDFRGWVSNDPSNQSVTRQAFDALKNLASIRLKAGLLTVIDATSVQAAARKDWVEFARAHDVLPAAIVLDLPVSEAIRRDAARTDRNSGEKVIRRHRDALKSTVRNLGREGFRTVHYLRSADEIDHAVIKRVPLLTDQRDLNGPFDAIGDVHGCSDELLLLLTELGYQPEFDEQGRAINAAHPQGRQALFLGDLVDRGPNSVGVLRLVMGMHAAGNALAVPGNHEAKLVSALRGKKVSLNHGLAETLAELSAETAQFRQEVLEFCSGLVSHLVLDGGKLVAAHAGLKEEYHNRSSGRVRAFALYGDTSGEVDEYGLPVRYPWQNDYRGKATVLYGHTPVTEAVWVNNTMCLDTACVFGGKLSALRYPERQLVAVKALKQWAEPSRPVRDIVLPEASDSPARPEPTPSAAQGDERQIAQRADTLPLADLPGQRLQIAHVLGRRVVSTAQHGRVGITAEAAAGALETMSRFAADPRWLVYLPPTMSPAESSARPEFLEHPEEAFNYYRKNGVQKLLFEEKHMGSRAVIIVAKSPEIAAARFGFETPGSTGMVLSRTGRAFFTPQLNDKFTQRVNSALKASGIWQELDADWLILDAEIMPWSLKADELVRRQYAATGAAGETALAAAEELLAKAQQLGVPVQEQLERVQDRAERMHRFREVYRRYTSNTEGLAGVTVAPFQILAAGNTLLVERAHSWHLDLLDRLVAADGELFATTRRIPVHLGNEDSLTAATEWWLSLTEAGGEGAVLKPDEGLPRGSKGLIQPGLKVRGREYLRIIYGSDYDRADHLSRLKKRNTALKRSLALKEYALGLEALQRFCEKQSLSRVHEAVFAVLALESEKADPRL